MEPELTPELFAAMNQPVPRYTSYPTAPEWHNLDCEAYSEHLTTVENPLSLYVHIPFCHSMCLFCGCSVILNRNPENETLYVDHLLKELDLVCAPLGSKKKLAQLHFGGGTPTKLSIPLFEKLFQKIQTCFEIDFQQEVAIEIDPRTVFSDQGHKLKFLKQLGFNRISFGVQDLDPEVQEAIRRRQSREMTVSTYLRARELGFQAINIDLIYGLPFQTLARFERTIDEIIRLKPDRIALFSYAKIPWLKAHQKAIPESTLPLPEEKFRIYAMARKRLVENGYIAIGMDHFAKAGDDLALAYFNKQLQRNFQGYSLKLAEHHLGIGVTSIGFVNSGYFQNLKELPHYYKALDEGKLPIHRGKILTKEDLLHKWTIHTLMCNFELNKQEFSDRFSRDFDSYFHKATDSLSELQNFGLILNTPEKLSATPLGELFIRNIASHFDAYFLHKPSFRQFSQAI